MSHFDEALKTVPCTAKWQKIIIKALTEVGVKAGPTGIMLLVSSLKRSLHSNESPDLSRLSLKAASNLTAVMQQEEAERKAEVNDFLDTIKSVLLGSILSGV